MQIYYNIFKNRYRENDKIGFILYTFLKLTFLLQFMFANVPEVMNMEITIALTNSWVLKAKQIPILIIIYCKFPTNFHQSETSFINQFQLHKRQHAFDPICSDKLQLLII